MGKEIKKIEIFLKIASHLYVEYFKSALWQNVHNSDRCCVYGKGKVYLTTNFLRNLTAMSAGVINLQ